MKKNKLRTAVCVMLVGTVLAAFAAIATEVGSQGDPLVTLSYLNETFMNQILSGVDEKLLERNVLLKAELEERISRTERDIMLQLGGSVGGAGGGTAVSFTAVTLAPGQTLYGDAGCEVMLRSGSAFCYSPELSSPGLVDSTEGTVIEHGAPLAVNHLYMMTARRGVSAAGDVVLLVRGDYVIG